MRVSKKHIATFSLIIWLLIIIFFMILSQNLNLEIFFVLWLIGLLVIVELIDPPFSQPRYIRYIKYVVAAGVVIFGVIVAQKVLEIIGS
jgi:hypothetical protein